MEKWQLAGIITRDSRQKLVLPTPRVLRRLKEGAPPAGQRGIGRIIRTTLRKMTEVIALF